MRLRGTKVDWISRTEMTPPRRTTTTEMIMQKAVRSCTASSWSLMDRPMKRMPLISEPSSSLRSFHCMATTRHEARARFMVSRSGEACRETRT